VKIDCKKLKELLLYLLDGNVTHGDLTELVHLSRAIIQSHLGYIRNSITHLCLQQGLTVTDLAYDCIAEAFAKDEKNKFHQLENFVQSLNNDLETTPDIEIFLAFKSFLTRITDAQLARLYAQSDPGGAKIHRNIRDCLKQSDLFTLEKDFRGLVLKPKGDPSEYLAEYPREALEHELLNNLDHEYSTPELLAILHRTLVEQTKYRRSVPLVDVVQLFRKAYQGGFEDVTEHQAPHADGLTDFEIKSICTQVELVLKEKIVFTYLAHGKVNREEAEAIFGALNDICDDWCNGEQSQSSLLDYLKKYLNMNEETYESNYRTKMEYLVKIAREEFAARLMREL
jgi:hypothetical protein